MKKKEAKAGTPPDIDVKQTDCAEPAVRAEEASAQAEPSKAETAGEQAAKSGEDMLLTPDQQKELRDRFAFVQKERDDMLATAQRVQAEFDNFRRRNASARADALAEGAQDAVKALLPVFDSLELASNAANGDDSPLAQGVGLVLKQLGDALAKLGVESVDPDGKPFDPNFHNAIMREEAEGEVQPNTVTQVLQKGYAMKGRVLREALVKVAM